MLPSHLKRITQIFYKTIKLIKQFKIKYFWLVISTFITYIFLSLTVYKSQVIMFLTPSLKNIVYTFQKHKTSILNHVKNVQLNLFVYEMQYQNL